jgi:putative ABC transport system permease protein
MKFVPLVWRNLLRRKFRTTFTLLCIVVSFVLYAFLMTVRSAFSMGIDIAGVDRLWMINKVSIIQFMPISYMNDITAMSGVTMATDCTWFGGVYQNNPVQFALIATDIAQYLKLYPEFRVPPEQLQAVLADRQGVIVGKDTAVRYGWKIGDHIPIQATIWMPKQGMTWDFNIDGIYDGDKEVDKTQMFFRYDYFDENRRRGQGNVSWFVIKIDDPAHAADMAARLDAHFANSASETKTATEKAFIQDFAKQTGDIGAIVAAILAVVLFTILLVVANTMAQSVRERTSELAVLKTLGFSNGLVLGLVLAESLSLAVFGGGIGLGIMWMSVKNGGFNNAFLPNFILTGRDLAWGVTLCILLGVLAGALPAVAAMRLRITDALRRA